MASAMWSSILLAALTVPAASHWVQDLELYEDPPASGDVGKKAGEAWAGCVLKSCKSPSKFQNQCPEEDEQPTLYGTELAQDAVFASNLGEKATAVAAYMAAHSKQFKQDIKAIWANNGKGLLMGFPGNRPELIEPGNAKDYKIYKAQFQQENPDCKAGKRLGEIRMAVNFQKFIATDNPTTDGPDYDDGPDYVKSSVPLLRIKVENSCQDCGEAIPKGFYLRIQHTANPETDPNTGVVKKECSKETKVGEKQGNKVLTWEDTFEFTGRKALPCGSTGTFDVLLTNLQLVQGKSSKFHWPCEVKITLVSPCREELAYLHLTPPDTKGTPPEVLVAPGWLGALMR